MSNIAYVRVSTAEQNEARQIEALKKHNIDKWFTEKVSGKNMNRPNLKPCLTMCVKAIRFTSMISATCTQYERLVVHRGAVAGERRSLGIKQRKP